MREEKIRWENERYYYCKQYIWSAWGFRLVPLLIVVPVMTYLSFCVRKLFLEQRYFQQAATRQIQDSLDVMEWINIQVGESQWDIGCWVIWITAFWVESTILCAVLGKSYNLYKRGWIKVIPIILYTLEFVIMWVFYYRNTNLVILLFVLFLNLAPGVFSSRLLFPLESRPPAKGIQSVFEIFTKIIIQKL